MNWGFCESREGGGRSHTSGFEGGVGEVGGFRAGFADFELGFGEVCFFGGAFAAGGAHLAVVYNVLGRG